MSFHLARPSACWLELCCKHGKQVQGKAVKLHSRDYELKEKKSSLELYWFGHISLALGRKGPTESSLGCASAQLTLESTLRHAPQSELLPHGLSSHSTSCSSMTSTFESLLSHLT